MLRLVVIEVLGDSWLEAAGAPAVRDLERSRGRDAERRPGIQVSDGLIDYTETRQLTRLIRESWEQFEPVFGEQERTFGLLRVVDDERFGIAHSRSLVPFERDLLSGIAGQLRQQVSLWRNRDDPSTNFYPRIERVVDNYGVDGQADRYRDGYRRPTRLEVGDVISFEGSSFGDQKRPVLWFLSIGSSLYNPWSDTPRQPVAEGDDVRFTWEVLEVEVGEEISVNVLIDTEGRWKRHMVEPKYDDVRYFKYSVNPPKD